MKEAICKILAVLSDEHVCLWPLIKSQWTEPHEHTLYEFKRCSCGAIRVKNNGPSGDGQWNHPDNFRYSWEKERFDAALAKGG